ncbi:MAG: 2-polyprenylphenol 6-hydroxylase [Alphaproteobacteria bacterium]
MSRALRNLVRLLAIARILARHDALFPLERLRIARPLAALVRLVAGRKVPGRPGERLAAALHALGPAFIKLGQVLSTRADLLGEEIATDLSTLQDSLPPFPGAEARAIVARELGRPVEEIFAEFEDIPVAAASIAQVHFARIEVGPDGSEEDAPAGELVAVKVLRPGIEAAFARDLDLFHWLAELAERTRPDLRRLRPVAVVETLAESVRMEMDLRLEAAAASELRANFAGDPSLRVPRVDWRRTARGVLTLERVEGIPIDEREALTAAGHDIPRLLSNAAALFFRQAFRDGFFHADMHPGNLFVEADGTIAAVDFGIMGRLDQDTRRYLARMLVGFLQGDYAAVADVHFEAGYIPAEASRDAFMQACRAIGEPILDRPLEEISLARLLAQLFQVTEQFNMPTQPQLLLLQKTMMVVEGLGRQLDPTVNIWDLARPLIEDWMREAMGPEARLREAGARLAAGIERLPGLLTRLDGALAGLGADGLRLAPETVAALRGEDAPTGARAIWRWAAAAAIIAFLLGLAL